MVHFLGVVTQSGHDREDLLRQKSEDLLPQILSDDENDPQGSKVELDRHGLPSNARVYPGIDTHGTCWHGPLPKRCSSTTQRFSGSIWISSRTYCFGT